MYLYLLRIDSQIQTEGPKVSQYVANSRELQQLGRYVVTVVRKCQIRNWSQLSKEISEAN